MNKINTEGKFGTEGNMISTEGAFRMEENKTRTRPATRGTRLCGPSPGRNQVVQTSSGEDGNHVSQQVSLQDGGARDQKKGGPGGADQV